MMSTNILQSLKIKIQLVHGAEKNDKLHYG
jgi:hypothetical protein